MSMESSVQERNTQFLSKEKTIEKLEIDEVDSYQLLITVQYIAKNGRVKSNAQFMKMQQAANQKLFV